MASSDKVGYKKFESSWSSWEQLMSEAALFATEIGRDNLISISHSEDKNRGLITVWFWQSEGP